MNSPFNVRVESWPRLSALLDEAFEMDAAARAVLVGRTRAEDAELGAELARLLPDVGATAGSVTIAPAAPFESLLQQALGENEAQDSTGLSFGAWTLVAKLGQGGMGEVWRAVRSDGLFQGSAAIKLLRSDLPTARLAARFARERTVLARLNHPNIARLLDAGVAHNQAFIVLELVDGLPLLDFVRAHAPAVADRVRLIRDIARAVEHAHSQLVLHRDLKPSNVLVTHAGSAKLLDFGIAAALDEAAQHETAPNLTQLTGRGHTLEYAAPEQILGEPTIAASDVYSLGAMLFHLLTGQRPFAASANRAALEYAAVHTEAPRASTTLVAETIANDVARAEPVEAPHGETTQNADMINPPDDGVHIKGDLDAIIAKALRKSPADRYTTASAFVSDLDAWLAQTPISIRAEDRSYRARLWFRRNWKLASLGTIAAAAVVVGLAVSLWQRSEAINAAALAQSEAARANKVADYLGELIQSASPDSHGGTWPTVLALLEQSEKDLDGRFKDDPKTHATLLKRMADTNDALNRDTVALAQLQRLQPLLDATESPTAAASLESRQQIAQLLRRLRRYPEALTIEEPLLKEFVARFGSGSEQHGKLLLGVSGTMAGVGRMKEARQMLTDGAAILTRLHPQDLAKRIDLVNDAAVLLTRQAMWREALDTLVTIEPELPAFAKLGGQSVRDSLIMRRNLEAIRIRIGRYDGVEARLRKIIEDADMLLGKDNLISANALDNLGSLACETARFSDCLELRQQSLSSRKQRVGGNPGDVVDAEITALTANLAFGKNSGAATLGINAELDRLFAAVEKTFPDAGADRADTWRMLSDAASMAGYPSLADTAQRRARDDLIKINRTEPERQAQIARTAALTAFVRGDVKRAAELLDERFRVYETTGEGDSPRRAALWLQRAIYEVEFDPVAAAKSAAQSRVIFDRLGGPQPQFKALLAYVDARTSANGNAIRTAEDAVDRIYGRSRPAPWRAPFLSSL